MQQKQIPKKATGVDKLQFVKKINLANLKEEVDKSNIGKLETTSVDF